MTRFVIGDVHGCASELHRLLKEIGWRPGGKKLWLVGDIVNRGRDSLGVLRWAFENREWVQLVLGNHDLHLLARWAGVTSRRSEDSLSGVLRAPDADRLLDWFRKQPLVVCCKDRILVHAGFLPTWDRGKIENLAAEVSEELAGKNFKKYLERLYAMKFGQLKWDRGDDEVCRAAAVFTRIRMVSGDGNPLLKFTGAPENAEHGAAPWFHEAEVIRQGNHVYFGHWAQMGFIQGNGATCLDSACVYGGTLSAVAMGKGTRVDVRGPR